MKKDEAHRLIEESHESGVNEERNRVLEMLNRMIIEENKSMELNPRNTKFVELRLQALEDFREKLIYPEKDIIV